jgi:hypothetical protein
MGTRKNRSILVYLSVIEFRVVLELLLGHIVNNIALLADLERFKKNRYQPIANSQESAQRENDFFNFAITAQTRSSTSPSSSPRSCFTVSCLFMLAW